MIRVNVLAEGQSEMTFVKKTLNEYFDGAIILDSRAVLTSRDNKTNHEYRGGMTNYLRAREDIVRWMKKDQSAYVSTMFDLFRTISPDIWKLALVRTIGRASRS